MVAVGADSLVIIVGNALRGERKSGLKGLVGVNVGRTLLPVGQEAEEVTFRIVSGDVAPRLNLPPGFIVLATETLGACIANMRLSVCLRGIFACVYSP